MSAQYDSNVNIKFIIPTGVPDANGDIISPDAVIEAPEGAWVDIGHFSKAAIVVENPLSCGELQELKAQWEQLFKGSSIATVSILEPEE